MPTNIMTMIDGSSLLQALHASSDEPDVYYGGAVM